MGRRIGEGKGWRATSGRGWPAIKSRAHAGSLWITALIESVSDVPWSRVILLPKQLLSFVVYSHLYHPLIATSTFRTQHFTPQLVPPTGRICSFFSLVSLFLPLSLCLGIYLEIQLFEMLFFYLHPWVEKQRLCNVQ